jgi:hypothetical protein
MMKTFRPALLAAALVVLASRASAQATPEDVARRYYETFRSSDWAANAAMMHPEALAQFKGIFTQLADLADADSSVADLQQMFGVQTGAELKALPDAQLYSRFLSNILGQQEELRQILASSSVEVLGHVPEGADKAHVVYRMTMGFLGSSMTQMQVMSLQKEGGQWKVLLTGDMQNIMGAITAGVAGAAVTTDTVPEPPQP